MTLRKDKIDRGYHVKDLNETLCGCLSTVHMLKVPNSCAEQLCVFEQ